MKKYAKETFIITIYVFIISCGVLDFLQHELVGTWNIYSYTDTAYGETIYSSVDFSVTWIFNNDETITANNFDDGTYYSYSGTWSTSDNILTVVDDDTGETSSYTYEVSQSTLTLWNDYGSGIFHKE